MPLECFSGQFSLQPELLSNQLCLDNGDFCHNCPCSVSMIHIPCPSLHSAPFLLNSPSYLFPFSTQTQYESWVDVVVRAESPSLFIREENLTKLQIFFAVAKTNYSSLSRGQSCVCWCNFNTQFKSESRNVWQTCSLRWTTYQNRW